MIKHYEKIVNEKEFDINWNTTEGWLEAIHIPSGITRHITLKSGNYINAARCLMYSMTKEIYYGGKKLSCLDKTLKIYLAGKMSGLTLEQMNDWRISITNRLNVAAENTGYNIVVINPVLFYNFEEKKHQSEKEIRDYDLSHATTSDIVIVNLDGLGTSDGTKFEIHDCNYHKKIPVIAFGERRLYEDLHPWVKDDITRVEENAQDVVNYIRDFYMI